jgi:hypothetical protein
VGLGLLIGISGLVYAALLHFLHAMRLDEVLAILRRKPKMGDTLQE